MVEGKSKKKNDDSSESTEEKKAVKVPHQKLSAKVSRLGLAEIEQALEEAEKKMGGLGSKYCQFLLARRNKLMQSSQAADVRKAA